MSVSDSFPNTPISTKVTATLWPLTANTFQPLGANPNRLGFTLCNWTNQTCLITLLDSIGFQNISVVISANATWSPPVNYTGRVQAKWSTTPSSGQLHCTEYFA